MKGYLNQKETRALKNALIEKICAINSILMENEAFLQDTKSHRGLYMQRLKAQKEAYNLVLANLRQLTLDFKHIF